MDKKSVAIGIIIILAIFGVIFASLVGYYLVNPILPIEGSTVNQIALLEEDYLNNEDLFIIKYNSFFGSNYSTQGQVSNGQAAIQESKTYLASMRTKSNEIVTMAQEDFRDPSLRENKWFRLVNECYGFQTERSEVLGIVLDNYETFLNLQEDMLTLDTYYVEISNELENLSVAELTNDSNSIQILGNIIDETEQIKTITTRLKDTDGFTSFGMLEEWANEYITYLEKLQTTLTLPHSQQEAKIREILPESIPIGQLSQAAFDKFDEEINDFFEDNIRQKDISAATLLTKANQKCESAKIEFNLLFPQAE
ncbi:MAG: hypothetical protein HOE11_02970 [Candidatus Diapherotrites archaeon]|jgi:hypothetical protein|nr:hypothetical protein [Candidatus Diapherotrites archaeon]MBT4596732.1 hypothetical protein [Candidatus Diapherotrites archaeon]